MAQPRKRSRADAAREQMYRSLVLECAERVFARGGYHASKMQEVAAEAGISLGTLYATFPSKRELFEELHEFRGREFLAAIEPCLSASRPVLEALDAAVHAFVAYLAKHADYFRVDLQEGRSWAVGDVEASPTFQAGIRLWTALMERGIEAGVFHEEDPELMATSAFGLMQVQLAVLMKREPAPDPERIAGRIVIQLERLLCRPEAVREADAPLANPLGP